ncbi:MAG: DUF2520 domain-containing protein [Eubacterium sp.]|nr:DUF2520 domain-containing protein [Eubacterium sp.]
MNILLSKIGFIGAGKVGFSLGKLFAEGDITVTGYYSRRREDAQQAATFTGTKQYDGIEELIHDSDVLFLTVPDGEITAVWETLKNFEITNKIICHCSGAMTVSGAFPDIDGHGAYGYSIHPLFPVNNKLTAYKELAGAFFCLEGDGRYMKEWQTLFASLGVRTQIISAENKAKYHAACAISSNLVCALVQESLDLLAGCGFSEENAIQALAPLINSNIQHIINDGVISALTGPVERCDTDTVAKHLSCLPTESEREMYRYTSLKLLETARRKNPDRDYSDMENILK